MSQYYGHNNFNGLNPFATADDADFANFASLANGAQPSPFFESNGTAGQYYNGESSRSGAGAGNSGFPLMSGPLDHQENFSSSLTFAGPEVASSPVQVVSDSPRGVASTEPSSPTSPISPIRPLTEHSQRFLNSLPENIRLSVGRNRQLDRMIHENPHFIPTFNYEAAMSMTGRDVVNNVSGPMPSAIVHDNEALEALRNELDFDFNNITCEELAGKGHEFLDMIARRDEIADTLAQYRYEPEVGPETISAILPNVGKTLEEKPWALDWYQEPLRKGDDEPDDDLEADPAEGEEENEEQAATTTKGKGKGKKGDKKDTKYLPRKVQYAPYRYMFKTAEEARAHRKKIRHPAKIAKDIDRVQKYGRYYWTKRIYDAMINVDLIFDNKGSVIATNFSKIHHFKEEDLEATAHHIFDACIGVHRRGWYGYDYNRRAFVRGKLKDIFNESIEGRLERICGILKHNKAIANDCVQGGDLLMQTVDNPIYRASTKTANNKGNLDRAGRLKKQETDRQREKRLAREAAQKEKAEEKARKAAEKLAEKERKEAEKQAAKEKKQAEKEAAAAARTAAAAARKKRA
ncbi:uncharacterized protein N0V89_003250 [Didymosphaeria variabile]|uniref:Uncharacterized protein n=1 Tax=Didymosphaeria variabile TaxID=1932322 RepID=A0A9W8XTM4_9PLEO|nr:uncharacterized protein N0V89_003250 [Didymosphaeria variabile]KAJ4358666.1 hypothetical protein N0V89_003250 [Didymosphaeria variabile]